MYAEMKKRGEPIPVERANVNTAFDDEERWSKDAEKFTPALKFTSKVYFALGERSYIMQYKNKEIMTLLNKFF